MRERSSRKAALPQTFAAGKIIVRRHGLAMAPFPKGRAAQSGHCCHA